MARFYYDLHMHSCLSPCADNEMTPASMAGMAALNGLQIAALTDHNSSGNVPAFFEACRAYGVVPIAGMELETAESVHLVCLFPEIEKAMDFWNEVRENFMMPVQNKPAIFGEQLYMNSDDEVTGHEETLLITSTTLYINDAVRMVKLYGGAIFPAHIDRPSNGIITVLGDIPEDAEFTVAEFNDSANIEPYRTQYPLTAKLRLLVNSDAHRLININEAKNFLELDADASDEDGIRNAFFAYLFSK